MARMPDGWVITVESDRKALEVRISGSRELVTCKSCWKRGLDNCPMEFYWDCHPAEDDCFCAMGERLPPNRQPVHPSAAKVEEATGTTGTEAD